MSEAQGSMFPVDRTKAFADAVLAIVATILVLGIDVPTDHDFSRDGMLGLLGRVEDDLHSFVGSFLIVGIYWINHAIIFHWVYRGNRALVWLNLLFLLVVSPIPFLTKLRAVYPEEVSVAALFSGAQIICCIVLVGMWRYCTKGRRLVPSQLSEAAVRSLTLRIAMFGGLILVAAFAALIEPFLGTGLLACSPLLFFSHRELDTPIQTEPD